MNDTWSGLKIQSQKLSSIARRLILCQLYHGLHREQSYLWLRWDEKCVVYWRLAKTYKIKILSVAWHTKIFLYRRLIFSRKQTRLSSSCELNNISNTEVPLKNKFCFTSFSCFCALGWLHVKRLVYFFLPEFKNFFQCWSTNWRFFFHYFESH